MKLYPEDVTYYLGTFNAAYMGYAADPAIRKGAASGGVVSALLIHMLERGAIDGAVVSRITLEDGQMKAATWIATDRAGILDARTSIYFDFDPLRPEVMDAIDRFEGGLAFVGLPCDISRMRRRMEKNPQLKDKIKLLIGLFCGHNSRKSLVQHVLQRKGIAETDLAAFTFRKGLWRGHTHILLKDGTERRFPFQHFSHYQNLHVLAASKCSPCIDHTAEHADISAGDIWLQRMKHVGIKHSVFLSRSPSGDQALAAAMESPPVLQTEPAEARLVFASNKRALIYHKAIAARSRAARLFGKTLKTPPACRPLRWNEFLAAMIVYGVQRTCEIPRGRALFFRLPRRFVWAKLAAFKLLTNF